jgi:hypothetical protein
VAIVETLQDEVAVRLRPRRCLVDGERDAGDWAAVRPKDAPGQGRVAPGAWPPAPPVRSTADHNSMNHARRWSARLDQLDLSRSRVGRRTAVEVNRVPPSDSVT